MNQTQNGSCEIGDIRIVAREATALDDMRREIKRDQAIKANDSDEAVRLVRLIAWPDLTCCLVESQGLPEPLTFESFCDLPKTVMDEWSKLVYGLNPSFLGLQTDPKKALKPGAGSGSSPRKRHRATSQNSST